MDAQGSNVNVKTFYFFDGLRDGRNKMDPGLDNSFFDGINIYAVDGCLKVNDNAHYIENSQLYSPLLNVSGVSNTSFAYTNPLIVARANERAFVGQLLGVQIPLMWGTGASGASVYAYLRDNSGVSNFLFDDVFTLDGYGSSNFRFGFSGYQKMSLCYGDRLYFGVTGVSGDYFWATNMVNFYHATSPNNEKDNLCPWGEATALGGLYLAGDIKHLIFSASYHRSTISSAFSYHPTSGTKYMEYSLNGGLYFAGVGAVNYLSADSRLGKLMPTAGTLRKMYFTDVNMNDRYALIAAGPSDPPVWVNNFSGVSSMVTYFKNGTTSDASGYQLATVWPLVMREFKNRLHLDNVAIQYSDASGLHTECYPHSSFASDGYIPDVFDWDNEILFDTHLPITNTLEYRDCYFRWTEKDVYFSSYDSNGVATPIQKILGAPGTPYRDSAAVVNNLLYWANDMGVYATDGSSYSCITSAIDNLWKKYVVKEFVDAYWGREIRVFGLEKTGELFVSVVFVDKSVGLGAGSSTGGLTLIYNTNTKTWGRWEIPLAAVWNPYDDSDYFLTAFGGMVARPYNNISVYAGLDATSIPDLYLSYGATNHARVEKACLLSPDYSKQADMVYARVMMKGCSCASQAFKITTFWDGQPSSPNAQALTFNVTPTQTGYDDVVTTNKFLLPGKGNLAYFKLERDPVNHGDYPLEFIGIQIQYSLVDRSDE